MDNEPRGQLSGLDSKQILIMIFVSPRGVKCEGSREAPVFLARRCFLRLCLSVYAPKKIQPNVQVQTAR